MGGIANALEDLYQTYNKIKYKVLYGRKKKTNKCTNIEWGVTGKDVAL